MTPKKRGHPPGPRKKNNLLPTRSSQRIASSNSGDESSYLDPANSQSNNYIKQNKCNNRIVKSKSTRGHSTKNLRAEHVTDSMIL